jgi:hypothetical protein
MLVNSGKRCFITDSVSELHGQRLYLTLLLDGGSCHFTAGERAPGIYWIHVDPPNNKLNPGHQTLT